jgi:hypothetical protein
VAADSQIKVSEVDVATLFQDSERALEFSRKAAEAVSAGQEEATDSLRVAEVKVFAIKG